MLVREGQEADLDQTLAIINDAALAYRGVIPDDRWHEPYMSREELQREIANGVLFWVAVEDGRLLGVMGIQDKGSVALVRHAYVAPAAHRQGVGTRLLHQVESLTDKPILIGTWAAASWAIDFYRRNGFSVVPQEEKERLLRTYWSIPDRQIETSVVLADRRWIESAADVKDINPSPRFALWLPVVLMWLLAAVPVAMWSAMFVHAVRASRFLGRWPAPYNPDPKALPIALQSQRIEAWVVGAVIGLVIFGGVQFTRRSGWRVRFIAAFVALIVLLAGWFVIARIDPGHVVAWYLE